jgi:hypothetical protein
VQHDGADAQLDRERHPAGPAVSIHLRVRLIGITNLELLKIYIVAVI